MATNNNDYDKESDVIQQIFEDSSGSEFSGYHSSDLEGFDSDSSESDGDRGHGGVAILPNEGWTERIGLRQVNACNMLSGPCLPRNFDVNTANPLDYFLLMMDMDMIDKIAAETNKYADLCQREQNCQDVHWQRTVGPTTGEEIKAYFGLCILMGPNPMHEYTDYWCSHRFSGCEGFKQTLTVNRYDHFFFFFFSKADGLINMACKMISICTKYALHAHIYCVNASLS